MTTHTTTLPHLAPTLPLVRGQGPRSTLPPAPLPYGGQGRLPAQNTTHNNPTLPLAKGQGRGWSFR